MADAVARIILQNNRTYRGAVADADTAKTVATHVDGDILQIHGLRRYYKYDAASLAANDDLSVIQPNDVVGAGRWVCSPISIGGYPYFVMTLDGSQSILGDGTSITNYQWVLVDEPAEGVTPATLLVSLGSTAELKIPIDSAWRPGGIFVFLRVTNNVNQSSSNDPFNPLTPELGKFFISSATQDIGLVAPAAGARNWQRQYRETLSKLDGTLGALQAGLLNTYTHTDLNKNMYPSAPAIGDAAAVSGCVMAATPGLNGYVRVFVNGAAVSLGDGLTTGSECYFSDDGGLTAKAVADITVGDQLYWNASVAGYDLDEDDLVEFDYEVVVV